MQKLLYSVGGFFALLIVIGLALPRHARVVVNAEIDAPVATVFALANDFRRASLWLPWLETDPNARIVYSGPDRGVGATITWNGLVVGTGAQVITESTPFERIEMVINLGERGEARAWFDFVATDGLTSVSWSFEADYGYNLVGRYAALLLTGVIHDDYEHGLNNLRNIAESLPRADYGDLEIVRMVLETTEIAYLPTSSAANSASLSEAVGRAYFQILNFMDEHGLVEAGAPLSITRSVLGSNLLFDAAIPVRGVTAATPRSGTGVKIGKTYAGTVIRAKHLGSYRELGQVHQQIAAYLAALGIERNGSAWESYVSDPTKVPQAKLLTYVYYPIKP